MRIGKGLLGEKRRNPGLDSALGHSWVFPGGWELCSPSHYICSPMPESLILQSEVWREFPHFVRFEDLSAGGDFRRFTGGQKPELWKAQVYHSYGALMRSARLGSRTWSLSHQCVSCLPCCLKEVSTAGIVWLWRRRTDCRLGHPHPWAALRELFSIVGVLLSLPVVPGAKGG